MPQKKQQGSKPNILIITADQLRQDFIHAYGGSFMQTPNIDRLAEEGCIYTNAYSPNPVCIPARHNMMTGLTARHHGFDDNYLGPNAKPAPYYLPTFAQILSDVGYETIAIGKLHFQPIRRSTGYDYFYNMDGIPHSREESDYAMFLKEKGYGHIQSIHGVRHVLYMQPQRSLLPEKLHGSHWVADKAIEYFETTRGRKPFLMRVGFIQPHPPFDVPDEWADLYTGKIPQPVQSKTPLPTIGHENIPLASMPNENYINRMREIYAAAVSFVDYNVGRIIEKLREIGELDNTLVIFTADHAEMLGDLGTYQKFLPYDASCKIPFIVRFPEKAKPGSSVTDFVDLNDILPTLVDLAGTSYPADYDLPGESLFATEKIKDRNFQYVEHQRGSKRWVSLRNQRYKYAHYYGDDDQLFDLVEDPQETTNLLYNCSDEKILAIKTDLKSRLIAYEERYGLLGYIKEGNFIKQPSYEMRYHREKNFPRFPKNIMNEEERAAMNNMDEEILAAIAKEPIVKLSEINCGELLRHGGYTEEQIQFLYEKAKEQGSY